MKETAKLIIEVTAGVLPPEVQLKGGDNIMSALAGPPGGGLAGPDALEPTGWTRHRPEPEHTRRWAITSSEWHEANDQGKGTELLATRHGQALAYAGLLMLQPDRFNHVRVDWIWL